MNKRKPALGRGLSSLLAIEPADQRVDSKGTKNPSREINRTSMVVNPFQPRIDFDSSAIDELAESIDKQGLLQPIVVRSASNGGYEIISGERRFRALTKLGWEKIPVIVRDDVTDTEMLELALVENLQRENLNSIETALSYEKLIESCGYSHEELSQQIGKSRSSITNMMRLLKLPLDIQLLMREDKISMGHARALLGCSDSAVQKKIAHEIVDKKLSVREVEKKVKQKSQPSTPKKKSNFVYLKDLQRDMMKSTGLKTVVKENGDGKGEVTITYKNKEELEKLSNFLLGK